MYVDLELAKTHLNVEKCYVDEDAYIESLIEVAEERVAEELCITVEEMVNIKGDNKLPAPLRHAILLTIGAYYAHREDITSLRTQQLPQGVTYLTRLYRDYSK